MWFITKVKYNKTNEEGILKAVSEQYLVEAETFTEAESIIYGKLEQIVIGDFDVTDISKTKYTEVFQYETGDYWHKCKVQYVIEEEHTGKEKKITSYMLINADTVKEAYIRIFESLGNESKQEYSVPDIIETKIIEVFKHEK